MKRNTNHSPLPPTSLLKLDSLSQIHQEFYAYQKNYNWACLLCAFVICCYAIFLACEMSSQWNVIWPSNKPIRLSYIFASPPGPPAVLDCSHVWKRKLYYENESGKIENHFCCCKLVLFGIICNSVCRKLF